MRKLSNSVGSVVRVLGLLLGMLSLVALALDASQVGISSTFQSVLNYYLDLTDGIARLLEPAILRFLCLINVEIELRERWLHVGILLGLYFGAHVTSALRDSFRGAAVFYAVWGAIIAVTTSVIVGSVSPDSEYKNTVSYWWPVLAVFVFTLGNTIRSATFYRKQPSTWWQAFLSPMRHTFYLSIIAATIFGIGAFGYEQLEKSTGTNWGLLLLFPFVLALAVYRIWVNESWIKGAAVPGRSVKDRLRYSRQAHIGWGMLITLTGAMVFLLVGAGENIIIAD